MKVLIVDDDPGIVEAITIGLELQWPAAEIISARDGEHGVARFMKESPDVTLLDVTMPRLNGWEVLRQIRLVSSAPVIVLTARDAMGDKVLGLNLGADDYMTKPFSPLELFARIKAALRRTTTAPASSILPPFVGGVHGTQRL
ncbi:MAG TPA: response regulator [Chloroflexia bacterium]|nr:response regulator [Chloroflexia bacterium]